MNKTLLLILLDFLLLHMIHDSPWNKIEKENAHLSGGTDTYARHAEELQFVRLQMQANKEEAQGLADQLAFSRKGEADQASAYAKAQADKTNLKGQLDKAHAALSETEKQRLIALKDAAERQEIINLKGQDINTIKEQVAKRDKAIITLTNTVERLNSNIGDLKNQIGDLKSDFSTKITNLTNNNEELAKANGSLTKENETLTGNLNTAANNMRTANTRIDGLNTNLKKTSDELITKKQQLQAANTAVTGLTHKNDTLAKQRDKALTDKATALTQVKNLNTKIGEEQARTVAAKSLAQKQETRAIAAENAVLKAETEATEAKKARDVVVKNLKDEVESTGAISKKTLEEVVAQSKRIPQSPNKLFNEYLANRVPVQIQLSRSKRGVVYINKKPFSVPSQIKKTSQPILVKGEKYLYAILHADRSPFALGPQSSPSWEKAEGMFDHKGKKAKVHWLGFLRNDPRIIAVPLHKDQQSKKYLDVQKVYPLAKRPQDHPEAVIIHDGKDYGVVAFKVDPKLKNYVLMEKPTFIGKLFSRKFNPARGDVVLSRAGELLGIMVNNKYCLLIRENELDDHANSYAAHVVLEDKAHISDLSSTLRSLTGIIKAKPYTLH